MKGKCTHASFKKLWNWPRWPCSGVSIFQGLLFDCCGRNIDRVLKINIYFFFKPLILRRIEMQFSTCRWRQSCTFWAGNWQVLVRLIMTQMCIEYSVEVLKHLLKNRTFFSHLCHFLSETDVRVQTLRYLTVCLQPRGNLVNHKYLQ